MNGGNKMREFTYQWKPEDFENEDEPILKISKSSYQSFQWCPTKYEFAYRQRLPYDTSPLMIKGSEVHNARQSFFDEFDVKKAESMTHTEIFDYCVGLHPIDDHAEIYRTMSTFEADRFITSRTNDTLDNFMPIINEVMLDAQIVIPRNINKKIELERDYVVHLQGIVDRMYYEDGKYIPIELKTGLYKDWKATSVRRELAFYKLLFEGSEEERLHELGLDPNIPISNWGWYYPESNYLQIEKAKKRSITGVMNGFAKMIHAYEKNQFDAKYYYKTCPDCSYFNICDVAQSESFL